MVNWQEAGKTWPQPHPHAVRLLRGLLWGQHYRHSNPQCEGGMPGSFELRKDMGEDRLQAVEDWLRVEGYAYRFRQKRWRVWTRPDRPGEGLRPDGIEEDENPNEYPSGATINVSMWDMIEKKFPEPGNERTPQGSSSSASPGKEKRSAGDRKRDKKWREYQESLAAEAAQGAKGGTPAPSPKPGLVPYAVHERVPSANAYRLVLIPHSTCVVEMVPQTGTALQHARTLDGKLPDELKYCEKHAAGSKVYYRCW